MSDPSLSPNSSAAGPVKSRPAPRPSHPPRSRQHQRLASALPAQEAELEYRIAQSKAPHDAPWVVTVRNMLAATRQALDHNDLGDQRLDESWSCLGAAYRHAVFGLDEGARLLLAKTLQAEASKLTPWRQKAIDTLLTEEIKKNTVTPEHLYEALRVRDDYFNTQYFRVRLLQDQLRILLMILIGVIVLVLTLSIIKLLPLGDWQTLIGVALFGALGAVVSAVLSLASTPTQSRIPEQIVHFSITLMRPALGAAAAIAIYVFLQSDILNLPFDTPASILAVAFVSGFSEGFLIRAVEAVAGRSPASTQKPEGK